MDEAYGQFAALYDPLMGDVDYDGWAAYLAGFLTPGGRVVDCACGTGEITLRLAKLGFQMLGVDISSAMLDVAAAKARRGGLQIPFICQDMAALSLHQPCDGLVCACDGVNYLDSLGRVQRFFRAAHKVLRPGGMFLFDISSAYKLENILGGHTFGEDRGDCAYVWQNAYDGEQRLLEMDLTFFQREKDGRYRRFTERHIQRAHRQEELLAALLEAGFRAQVFHAFTQNAPELASQRLQFVAERI